MFSLLFFLNITVSLTLTVYISTVVPPRQT